MQCSNPTDIVKIGEGTYGEAFKVGENVCKIVPFDGDLRVNGEIQKVLVQRTSLFNSVKEKLIWRIEGWTTESSNI